MAEVRRTPQHEALLELRLACGEAAVVLKDTPDDALTGALVAAKADVVKAWDRAIKAGVSK